MKFHHWSGWPGAICLDCFAEDQVEICLAEGCPGNDAIEAYTEGRPMQPCPIHVNGECLAAPNPRCGQCKAEGQS